MKLIPCAAALSIVAVLFLSGIPIHAPSGDTSSRNYIPSSASGVITAGNEIGNAPASQNLFVLLTLNYRDQAGLNAFLADVQKPSSPLYHKYLSSQQFVNRYSPSSSEYYGYAQYLESLGLSVSTYQGRTAIGIHGTVKQMDTAFHTQISLFSKGTRTFYAPTLTPWLSYGNPGEISGIIGLSNQNVPKLSPMFETSRGNQVLYGADLQSAYQLSSIYGASGYPTNETIATLLWSGVNSNNVSVAPFVPSDVSYYLNNNVPAGQPRSAFYGYPVGGAPPPGASASTDATNANIESTLDLEMAGSTAPGATLVEVYGPQPTMAYLDLAFGSVLYPNSNSTINTALSHVVAISNSWGGTDGTDSLWAQYEQTAAARGITVLAATGDNGNSPGPQPSFPATYGYNNSGTLAVGGSYISLLGSKSTNGSGTTGIQSQSVWFNSPNTGNGSQGGVSSNYSEPSWQLSSTDANSVITGASSITGLASGRGTPDIAGVGANMTMYMTYGGSAATYYEIWGTSIASPLVAGLVATMDHYLGPPEGFMNPLVYKLAQAEYNGSYSSSKPFYFITNGTNALFPSTNGYSLSVGWGSINAYNFVKDQNSLTSYNVTFNESGLPAGTLWSLNITGVGSFNSTASSIDLNLSNGNYNYTVTSSNLTYIASGGTFTVKGSSIIVPVSFTRAYAVTFRESGLPASYFWYINVTGQPIIGPISSNNYTMDLRNGTYGYSFTSNSTAYAAPPGSFTVAGAPVTVNQTFTKSLYQVTFQFSTTANLTWYLNVSSGQKYSNTSSQVTFMDPNGTYGFTVASGNKGYYATPSSGNFTVAGTPATVNITFSPILFKVIFNQTGLPTGYRFPGDYWTVAMTGLGNYSILLNSSSSQASTDVLNGTYNYSIKSGNSTYAPSRYHGVLNVNGSNQSISIAFHPVLFSVNLIEQGLPLGTEWSASYLNGSAENSTGSVISFNVVNGTYQYRIHSFNSTWRPANYTTTVIVSGSNVTEVLNFHKLFYHVVFRETGLPSGTLWKIWVAGSTFRVNGTTLTLLYTNGTIQYSVPGVGSFQPVKSAGNITVNGNNVTVTVAFQIPTNGASPLTYFYLVIIVGAAVLVAFLYWAYSKRK